MVPFTEVPLSVHFYVSVFTINFSSLIGAKFLNIFDAVFTDFHEIKATNNYSKKNK